MYFGEAARSLYATRQRSLLALIGIVIGIGAVISLVSIGNIVGAEAIKEFRSLGTDVITLQARSENLQDLRQPALFRKLPPVTPCVAVIAPYVRVYTDRETADEEEITWLGVDQGFARFANLSLAAGRFVSSLDGERPHVVLGAAVLPVVGEGRSAAAMIGQEISVDEQLVRVVGVLDPTPPQRAANILPDAAMFVPLDYLLAGGSGRAINQAVLRAKSSDHTAECANDIEAYFKRRIRGMSVQVATAKQLITQMRKQADLLAILLTAIGSISLVVGGVGIMNIMLVSVAERKSEIGIRRALGAKRRDIRNQFLIESLLLSFVGGLVGIALSLVVTYYVADYNGWTFFISWRAVVLGAGISAAIGIVFGFIPAHQAAKLDPIESLRGE